MRQSECKGVSASSGSIQQAARAAKAEGTGSELCCMTGVHRRGRKKRPGDLTIKESGET